MWKIFAIIVLVGGLSGEEKDSTAEYSSRDAYPTKEACEAMLPGARKIWESKIANAAPIRGKNGKVVNPQIEIKKIYCSKEEVIK